MVQRTDKFLIEWQEIYSRLVWECKEYTSSLDGNVGIKEFGNKKDAGNKISSILPFCLTPTLRNGKPLQGQ